MICLKKRIKFRERETEEHMEDTLFYKATEINPARKELKTKLETLKESN